LNARDGGDDDSTLFDNAPCGLLTTTADGHIYRANRTFCAWLQYEVEQLSNLRFQALLTIGSKVFHQTHWMPLLQLQRSVAEVQFELVRSDGRVVPMLINAAQRTETTGERTGQSVMDIAAFVATDRRKYERELLAARKRAEELLESERYAQQRAAELLTLQESEAQKRAALAEQLVGIVSHDLRNPLNTVLLGASLLQSAELGEPHTKTVARIEAAGHRATRLIGDLLDFTQARLGGGLSVHRRTVDLHTVVADCLEELRFAWPGRLLEHTRAGHRQIAADPDRLVQLVGNLVNNALVYGSVCEPVVVSSCVDESSATITVHNKGAPIPLDKQAQIFEPLSRGEHESNKGFRSVGLGLYIVREIASAHGGSVALSSNATAGTTFVLDLPIGPA
jgi:phosphoserine phosphatase RsbU/P